MHPHHATLTRSLLSSLALGAAVLWAPAAHAAPTFHLAGGAGAGIQDQSGPSVFGRLVIDGERFGGEAGVRESALGVGGETSSMGDWPSRTAPSLVPSACWPGCPSAPSSFGLDWRTTTRHRPPPSPTPLCPPSPGPTPASSTAAASRPGRSTCCPWPRSGRPRPFLSGSICSARPRPTGFPQMSGRP